ncbi:MAG: tripartite tricarboxylate transporter substrate binding protein [Burkholderiaceae bacterium]|nr:tripartite tricarboxylate transporter substrate binding protein [Burkholderiaceae bacterium]
MSFTRRTFCSAGVGALLSSIGGLAAAATYPTRPVRFIVSWTPGGGADSMGRMLSKGLSERWGQPVVVENRPGADATLGIANLAMSPPDGYAIALIISSHAVHPSVRKALPYNVLRDLAPVTVAAEMPNLLLVRPDLPAKNVRELIALSKTKSMNYGAPGLGGPGHLGGVMFNLQAGTNVTHIPYGGASAVFTALLRGDVDFMFATMLSGMPLVKSGRLRALAITSAARSPLMPELPTVAESGLKGFELTTWYGIVARAGTPKPVIDQIATDIAAVLKTPEVANKIAAEGSQVVANSPDQFSGFLSAEVKKWAEVVKHANIQPE